MSSNHHIDLPVGMRLKLEAFRRRVWAIKLAEGLLAAAFGLLVSYLIVFASDRVWDTPAWLRLLVLVTGSVGLGVWFPLKWHRWVWRTRKLEQVARLLQHRFPRLGDQLLGIVELVQNDLEQERSETLCRAAVRQVDEDTRTQDFSDAVPNPRHRRWAWAAGVPLALAVAGLIIVPAAGTNALARWLMPWKDTQRYTFAQLDNLPDKIVVPYAEPFVVPASLAKETAWSPPQASARYGNQAAVPADLADGAYAFTVPPQKEPDTLAVSAGDARDSVEVQPMMRPELISMTARIKLPDYLQYSATLEKDVRGGSVSLLKDSQATFEATATRQLDEATVDGVAQQVQGSMLVTSSMRVEESASQEFVWRDHLGLSAKEPFVLSISALDDGSPAISCSKLSRDQVVLDEEVLSFQVLAEDDFGVKTIGMEWVGVEDPIRNPHPSKGEKIVSAGGPEERELDVVAAFSAQHEGVAPQTLQVRLFAVDYLPGRQRVYSPTYLLHVLSPEEHAIWITQQMRKWFRQAQAVYEQEHQLHATNKELRQLSPEEIDRPENRRRVLAQAAAESANAQRLTALTGAGEGLIQQAAKNSQFNVATLETWAAMLQSLEDIAANRMPSVADLLKDAANAPGSMAKPSPSTPSDSKKGPSPPQVGNNRDGRSGAASSKKGPPGKTPSKTPGIVDVESGVNELENSKKQQEPPPSAAGRMTLPGTVIQGGGPKQPGQEASCPAKETLDEAVQEQEDLLAEFAKVADALKKILDNLEGSTFVKRLKAASRRQTEVASDLNQGLLKSFGVGQDEIAENSRQQAKGIVVREVAQSETVSVIQDDLAAYFDRVQQGKFKTVLNEMKSTEVVGQLREIADTVEGNLNGQAIAQTEFWSDTLDRWAEQLVGPG